MSTTSVCSNDDQDSPRKSLRWESTCTLRYFERPSTTDIANAWYDDEDYKAFKKQCKILAKLGKEIGADTLETYCNDSYRGIEHFVKGKVLDLRKRSREAGWDTVLDEQHEQFLDTRGQGQLDWDRISSVYRPISKVSAKSAHLRALQDECDVINGETSSLPNIETNGKSGKSSQSSQSSSTQFKKIVPTAPVVKSSVACIPARNRWQDTSSFSS